MSEFKPLVSIVICTYNGSKFIADQIHSLIDQTYHNIEIVVCDDHSQDNTVAILNDILRVSNRQFRIQSNESNLGYIKNFEKGIALAKGEYIALCDQDDIWDLSKIEILAQEICDYSLIYSNSRLIDSIGLSTDDLISNYFNMASGNSIVPLLLNNSVSAHSLMFKRELINTIIPIPELIFHDWWIGIVASTYSGIKYLDVPLVNYRIHSSNATEIKIVVEGSKEKEKKKKVKKWDAFENIEKQITLFELFERRLDLNPKDRKTLLRYIDLTRRRNNQILSISNFVFWLRNYSKFLYCRKDRPSKKIRFVIRNLFGLAFKKLFYKLNNQI